jgi:FkbM family methyltransferase
MTDTKTGFIVTYFKTSEQGQQLLENLIDTISRENYYLVLASHSPISQEIQEKCDFYIFQEQNIVDDRKYSHGVAESNLIELALHHLRYKKIDWTYKVSYDVVIKDVSRFNDWRQDYKYNFVSCNWGSNILCTNSFFANVDFIIKNIDFYDSIDSMFVVNNVIENCWEKNIRDRGLVPHVFSYKDKAEFFGPHNLIDTLFYNYSDIEFWYDDSENRFYVKNNGPDYTGELRIFDYYTDLCVYVEGGWSHNQGTTAWIIPFINEYIPRSKNGFYAEIKCNGKTIRKNINIKDFNLKDPLYKKFKLFKDREVKFNEYSDFEDLALYSEMGIEIDKIKNYVDIGANYGFSSLPFIKTSAKIYMVEADTVNIGLLEKNFGNTSNIKIIDKAVCDSNTTVDFFLEQGCSVVSSLFADDVNGVRNNRIKITVPAITPDSLIENYIDEDSIDLMKVDIEGGEYIFFNIISDKNIKRVKKFIIEFHNNDNLEVLGILEKLAKNDFSYKLFNWGDYTDKHIVGNKMGIIYAYRQI